MESGRKDDQNLDAATPEGARALFLRLLQKLTGPASPAGDAGAADDALRPAGQRSGRGTRSLAPYLDHYRNSRPGPLE
jgi:hypothetical protein